MITTKSNRDIKVLIIDNKNDGIFVKKSLSSVWYNFEYSYLEPEYISEKCIREFAPNIVIVEVMLSLNQNGFEVCKFIKKINSSIKILLATKHQYGIDHARASEVGADEHTVKTKSNKYLLESFKNLLKH
jgi:DNA-binding response OmpR family regulator